MSTRSSYLPRLGFSRDGPILPLHSRTSPPIRKKPSEYDLADLSPRPDETLLSSDPVKGRAPYSPRRSPSPSARASDRARSTRSPSKSQPKQRILFAGPPPPIATSQMLYRDEEDHDTSHAAPRHLDTSSFARNINSVLFDRGATSPNRSRDRATGSKPDAVWLNLQHRERALQKDLQHLLDAQSAGLAANLNPDAPPSSAQSVASDASGRSTIRSPSTTTSHGDSTPRRHVTFDQTPTTTTLSGTLVPVRQPRPKPLGLRAARTGLARTIALLADLKAEEDAQLATALGARKQALSQLRRWSARRVGIAEELRALEEDGDEPLGSELRALEEERDAVRGEIAELEERLVGLRRRGKVLDARVEEVGSRREAGLSGYRGALREVDGKITGLLIRPGVKPLDGEAFAGVVGEGKSERESPGGVEFLRLRPERRTAEMAKDWWEAEVAILEKKKTDVDMEKAALEEGVVVWRGAVKLVSDFEAELRKEMKGNGDAGQKSDSNGKGREGGKTSPPSPEQAMFSQLDKMRAVIDGLQERLQIAEEQGWNLLICAISAELEAFRQADSMLRNALRAAGFDVEPADHEQGDISPPAEASVILRNSSHRLDEAEASGGGRLVDLQDGPHVDREAESDNEVPPDLLVSVEEDREPTRPILSREDSENEVPIEFLREHTIDDRYPSLEMMTQARLA
ncbi:hypothetical protein C8A05DRAFT_33649 [Staphylotrichum tortipilum]|uniref:Uncharacterized protein n=1 Tax=Staphylotrichum tortipilum TaxID=2831512 RepID=A0AAN6RTB3_9PEZI|nr:hypothetical protein C8A05DRAFT_33649 [Staphylotrichum longicolle]